jgi:hypothetical protein
MYLIVSKYLIPKGYRGMTIFPFVIIRNEVDKNNDVLINHEKIHIRQQLELLIIPFFIIYFIEFLIRLIQFRDRNLAYRSISFEKEAYNNEKNVEFLRNRQFLNFLKYLN